MTQQSQLDDNFERQYFEYVVNRAVPANAIQDPNQLTILSDADFEWWWAKASRTSSLLAVLMQEQGTGRQFITATPLAGAAFNGINIDNWAGQASNGAAFPLAVPYLMPATRTYLFLLTDTSAATNTVQICLSGFKLFPKPGSSSSSSPSSSAGSTGGGGGTSSMSGAWGR